MAYRRTRTLGAWVLAALTFGLAPAACIIAPEEVHGPCVKDSDCPDDGIPCTKEVCEATGFCKREPQDLPFGNTGCDDQNPCTDDLCQDGACAHAAAALPPTDGNECTADTCVNGVATYTPVKDGDPCGLGLKCTGGKCNCTAADQCGASTECLLFACEDSACSSTSLPAGSPVDGLSPGDCLQRVCDGNNGIVTVPDLDDSPSDSVTGNCLQKGCDADGNITDVPDPTDKPADDNNPCTTEGCNDDGTIANAPVANGTPCGSGPLCDAVAGGGFQTTPHDECQGGTCTTPSPMSCGAYTCNVDNTACRSTCGGMQDCVGGTFCDGATNLCTPPAGAGAACMNQGQCAAGTTCKDGFCCATACADTCQHCNEPNNEGICLPIADGQDPDAECPGQDACNGVGGCAKAIGGTCNGPNDCLSGSCADGVCCDTACNDPCHACNLPNKIGACSPIAANSKPPGCDMQQACDAAGNCKGEAGHACAAAADCLNGICSDGVCCNSTCTGDCARCDLVGTVGVCTNVPAGQQVQNCNTANACDGNNVCKKANGTACSNVNECASGFCPTESGQDFCCDTACAGSCQSCAGGKTVGGVNGVCSNIKANTDPEAECPGMCNGGTGCCNGMGACF